MVTYPNPTTGWACITLKENASKFKTNRRHFIRLVFGLTAPDEEQGPPPGGRFTGLDRVCLGLPGGDKGRPCPTNGESPKVSPIEPKGFTKLLPKDRGPSLVCMGNQIEIKHLIP